MTNAKDLLHELATKRAMARLLPVLGLTYFMSYVDRTNVALAKTALEANIGLSAAAYGLGAGLFFLSYALLEVPSNLILYRVGPRIWITRIALTWGALCAAMMFAHNDVSFYVLRILLGAAEAGLFPAMMYMVTRWFSQRHRVTIVGLIYTAPCVATIIGSPLGGALMEMNGFGGLRGWQWMFLIEGVVTMGIGVVVWFTLPGNPADAKWLTAEQAAELSARAVNTTTPEPSRVRGNLHLAFGSAIVLLLAAIYFINQAISSAIGFNFPAYLQSLGLKSSFLIGLVAGSGGISALAGVLFFPYLKRRYGREVLLIGTCAGAVLLVLIGFLVSQQPVWSVCLLFVANFFAFGTLPLFWSVAMSRMSGLVAAAGLAFINMVGITGGFVGPYYYGLVEGHAHSLVTPYYGIVAASLVGVLLVPVLGMAIRRERVRSAEPAAELSVTTPA